MTYNYSQPPRPRRVFSASIGVGKMPEEGIFYPQQILIRLGFGPGFWVFHYSRKKFGYPWKRLF